MPVLRRSLIVVLALLAVPAMMFVLIVWRGEEWARSGIESALQDRLVPTVRIAGPLEVSLVPRPRVTVTALELYDAAGERVMLIGPLAVELDTAGLMQGAPALTSLVVRGLDLVLRQLPDGRWNASEWLRPASGDSGGAALSIARLTVEDATLHLEGPVAGRLEGVRIELGPVALGVDAQLEVQGRLSVVEPNPFSVQFLSSGTVRFDRAGVRLAGVRVDGSAESGPWSLAKLGLRVGGAQLQRESAAVAVDDLTLSADLSGPAISARFQGRAARISGSHAAWRAEGLALDAHGESDGYSMDAQVSAASPFLQGASWSWPGFALKLSGAKAAAPVSVELEGLLSGRIGADSESAAVALIVERGSAEVPHPAGGVAPLKTAFSGAADFDPLRRVAKGAIRGAFDQTRFDGKWEIEAAAARPLAVELTLDRLDLDRYLPPEPRKGSPVDFAVWRNWPVEADLRIGELRVQGFVSQNARLRLVGEPLFSGAR